MKGNLRRLSALLKMVDMNTLFSISITNYDITVYANYNSDLTSVILKNKFAFFQVTEHGYLYFRRNNITLILS